MLEQQVKPDDGTRKNLSGNYHNFFSHSARFIQNLTPVKYY